MKKKHLLFALTILFLTIFITCNKDEVVSFPSVQTEAYSEKMILGEKLNNPYIIENMQIAFDNIAIANKTTSRLEPTDYYVKFLPSSTEELEKLELNLELFTHPLDYEIAQDGDYYIEPGYENEEFQWLYTVVPIDFDFQNFKYEIIDEAFLWHKDRNNQVSEEEFDKIELESEYLTKNITEEEYNDYKSGKKKKKHPNGCITADDNVVGQVAVKGVKIRAWRFLKISYAYTDPSGCFQFGKKFRSAHIKAFALDLFGNRARGATAASLLLFQVDIRHKLGNFSNNQLNGIQHNFPFSSAGSSDRKKWVAFSAIDAIWDMNVISTNNFQINARINNLHVWVSSFVDEWSAPCLNLLYDDGSSIVAYMEWYVLSFLQDIGISVNISVENMFLPDVYLNTLSNYNEIHDTRSVFYHEYAHVLEYKQCGIEFWQDYILHIVQNGGYGDGTGEHAGLIGLMEGWAEDYANSIAHQYYNVNLGQTNMSSQLGVTSVNGTNISNRTFNHVNEGNQTPNRIDGIRQGYFYDLQDSPGQNLETERVGYFSNGNFITDDSFQGWSYKTQYDAFGPNTRSYIDHGWVLLLTYSADASGDLTPIIDAHNVW